MGRPSSALGVGGLLERRSLGCVRRARRPDVFGAVAAFSAGISPLSNVSSALRDAKVRHYFAAGTLEEGFRRSTTRWAEAHAKQGSNASTENGSEAMTPSGGDTSYPMPWGGSCRGASRAARRRAHNNG